MEHFLVRSRASAGIASTPSRQRYGSAVWKRIPGADARSSFFSSLQHACVHLRGTSSVCHYVRVPSPTFARLSQGLCKWQVIPASASAPSAASDEQGKVIVTYGVADQQSRALVMSGRFFAALFNSSAFFCSASSKFLSRGVRMRFVKAHAVALRRQRSQCLVNLLPFREC